ncbi:Hpt domain-containing protein [Maribacter sedimenticola]|uniref:histidine kinase n=1 Tax=Maribacter sedimenticola TaxID=228956 RepID=A0ABY1SGU8_9FLAO|nr:ATP-binding protein [Maribacter sedimenticola]SNR47217.1 Hpt domain-containing protein [Maribacter sedimenticola]
MSISKTKDLIGQLSNLERAVSEFSFEELSADDAKELQLSFNSFRNSIEHHIYTPKTGKKTNGSVIKNKEKEEIEKKLLNQNQFIAHVSHEIRTPLNSIIGFANLLKEENLNESQDKKVQAIQFASTSLLKIINEVLEYSKISSGNINFETIDFNLSSLINDVMFLCQTLMLDNNIKMIVDVDDDVPSNIKGDPTKLSQVLLNLLGNSIKFINKGFIKLSVSVKKEHKDHHELKFTVTDTGIGISKEKLKKVFKRYAQAEEDTAIKYGGTGLGLSITKEIVEKQKGSITIESKEGKGTIISFTIPYAVGNAKNIPLNLIESSNIENGKKLLAGTEILVFEDNLMNQHLIKEQLMKWDCKVHTHVNLNKGLAVLANKKIDLVLMDLKMPNINGFEMSNAIRQHKNAQINTVPIVAFSADFTEQDSKDCKDIGINDFLLKPYTLNELMTVILNNKREKTKRTTIKKMLEKQMIEPKETTKVDLNNLLSDCFGELDMLNELVKLFKLNALEFIGNVKMHLKTENLQEIALSAHKLKAGFAMLKANGMRQLIVDLEANSKAGNLEKVKNLYQMFLLDYPRLEENIDYHLTILNKK